MAKKMNWTRVETETRERRHGVEWENGPYTDPKAVQIDTDSRPAGFAKRWRTEQAMRTLADFLKPIERR